MTVLRALVIAPDMRTNTGVGNATRLLTLALKKIGLHVDIITSQAASDEKFLLKINVGLQCFPFYNTADIFTFRGKDIFRVVNANVDLSSYNVIFCVAWQTWAVDIVRLFPDRLQKRCLIVSHGTYFKNHVGKAKSLKSLRWFEYKNNFLPKVLRKVAGLVVLDSTGVGDRFYDLFIAKKYNIPVFELPNSMHTGTPTSKSTGERINEINLISISGFNILKDPLFLIKTLPSHLNVRLKIFGALRTEYYEECRKLVSKRQLEGKVDLVVGASPEEIRYHLSIAHFNLISSKTECQPLSLIEGLSLGIPFLSREIPSLKSINGGIVVDDKSFWGSLEKNLGSATNYENLRKSAIREFEDKFSYDSYQSKLEAIVLAVSENNLA